MFVAGIVHGEYDLFELDKQFPFESVIVTPTNLMIKFTVGHYGISDLDDISRDFRPKRSSAYAGENEALVLTPTTRVGMGDFHVGYRFTPVVFKNQHKGFKIFYRVTPPAVTPTTPIKSNFWYVALSDTPMEVGEKDVEMIMEKEREWVKYERQGDTESPALNNIVVDPQPEIAFDTPPPHDVVPPPVETDSTPSPQFSPWLYFGIGILACLLAIAYFLRKKSK